MPLLQSIIGLLAPLIPLIIFLIQKFIPERVTHKRGEMKWVKDKKQKTIARLQKFHSGMTHADIVAKGKNELHKEV